MATSSSDQQCMRDLARERKRATFEVGAERASQWLLSLSLGGPLPRRSAWHWAQPCRCTTHARTRSQPLVSCSHRLPLSHTPLQTEPLTAMLYGGEEKLAKVRELRAAVFADPIFRADHPSSDRTTK